MMSHSSSTSPSSSSSSSPPSYLTNLCQHKLFTLYSTDDNTKQPITVHIDIDTYTLFLQNDTDIINIFIHELVAICMGKYTQILQWMATDEDTEW
jgi:hypothetical protein